MVADRNQFFCAHGFSVAYRKSLDLKTAELLIRNVMLAHLIHPDCYLWQDFLNFRSLTKAKSVLHPVTLLSNYRAHSMFPLRDPSNVLTVVFALSIFLTHAFLHFRSLTCVISKGVTGRRIHHVLKKKGYRSLSLKLTSLREDWEAQRKCLFIENTKCRVEF